VVVLRMGIRSAVKMDQVLQPCVEGVKERTVLAMEVDTKLGW